MENRLCFSFSHPIIVFSSEDWVNYTVAILGCFWLHNVCGHVFSSDKKKAHSWVSEIERKTTIANICAVMITNTVSLRCCNDLIEWYYACNDFISNNLRLRVAKLFVQRRTARWVFQGVLRPMSWNSKSWALSIVPKLSKSFYNNGLIVSLVTSFCLEKYRLKKYMNPWTLGP